MANVNVSTYCANKLASPKMLRFTVVEAMEIPVSLPNRLMSSKSRSGKLDQRVIRSSG